MKELHCSACDRVLLEYTPPLVILIRCRRCGAWNKVTVPREEPVAVAGKVPA